MAHISEKTLNAWIDGMLSETEAIHVEIHLKECKYCKQAALELRQLFEALKTLPSVSVEDDFVLKTLLEWQKDTKPNNFFLLRQKLEILWRPVSFAIILLGIITGIILGSIAQTTIISNKHNDTYYALYYTDNSHTAKPATYEKLLFADEEGDI